MALADGPLIDKTRHFVMHDGFEWEVDEFHGDNAGLVVAELELDARGPTVSPSAVARRRGDGSSRRYYNVCLVSHPYRAWTEAERNP